MAFPYPITGPIAPYTNVPINPQWYQPNRFVISAVTLGQTTTITATANMNFVIGQLVRLLIPPLFGCIQLNELEGYVISIPAADQVVLTIDSSRNVDAFQTSSATTLPQIIPVGDVNSGQINANGPAFTKTYIPGSFINISPL